jgi:hypothetical protein
MVGYEEFLQIGSCVESLPMIGTLVWFSTRNGVVTTGVGQQAVEDNCSTM